MPAATASTVTTPAPTSLKVTTAVDGSFDINNLFVADANVRSSATSSLTVVAQERGTDGLVAAKYGEAVVKVLSDKKNPTARQGAADSIRALVKAGAIKSLEPIFAPSGIYNSLLENFGDKTPAARTAAIEAVREYVIDMSPWAAPSLLPALLEFIKTAGKWQAKVGGLVIFDQLVASAPTPIALAMYEIVPVLSATIWDTKPEVKKAARDSLTKATALVSNKDIEQLIPALIKALINPVEEVPKTVRLLSATTFVSDVDIATLAMIAPLLLRGLNEKLTAIKRNVAVIVENMTKLVGHADTVRPLLTTLLPALLKTEVAIGDPEARAVVGRAIKTLRRVGQVPDGDGSDLPPLRLVDAAQTSASLSTVCKKLGGSLDNSNIVAQYASTLAANLANAKHFDVSTWETLAPFLASVAASLDSVAVCREWVVTCTVEYQGGNEAPQEEEEGDVLCDCHFSLAYGARVLIKNAHLRLYRNRIYGLCGQNGTGKSTFMGAIVNGQVEGFPSPDEVRTFSVAHDLDSSEADTSVLQFIVEDNRIQASESEIKEALTAAGFDETRQSQPIGNLSGGMKMRAALVRAMLFKADILLLDEPTNHLDVINIAWLENWLTSLTGCTSIIVSHDTSFLNNTITNVLHLHDLKLDSYRGNVEDFVKVVPEAKSYYTLEPAEDYMFRFPDPPMLEGVKTKEKSLIKMRHVGFQYPGSSHPQLDDITLQISLSSRVAVLGANGSGKSTLVKLILGYLEPNYGEVWRHPNVVIGYVAQHAFHHIDKHLDKTALEYMLWRYQTGEDLEDMDKVSRVISEEEKKKMEDGAVIVIDGQKRRIKEVVSRKKSKQSYEYLVTFENLSSSEDIYLSRDELVKRGFEKKVLEVDARAAQESGLNRPLVRREIEKHFQDVGLDPEIVSHSPMRGLSGGQKVKIAVGASLWRRPHVIILDEPTNYLDRESLAALIKALQKFGGGVLIVTHNREFSESICSEVWAMRDGHLEASGHNWVEGQGSGPRIDQKDGEDEDQYDAMGNKIEVKKAKKQTSNKARKERKKRIRQKGEGITDDEL